MADDLVFDVELVGNDWLFRYLAIAGAEIVPAFEQALMEEANLIFRESQVKVPLRFGTLKNSGRVGLPHRVFDQIFIDISYGGAAAAYAWYQHAGKRQDGTHVVRNYTTAGTGPNYLIGPVEEALVGMEARLAKRVEAIFHEMGR